MDQSPSWEAASERASWLRQNRSKRIRRVVIGVSIFVVIATILIVGFTYPPCNQTQVRGFFRCNCAPGSALQTNQTNGDGKPLCICLNNGNQLGGQCDDDAEKVRFVFGTQGYDSSKWTFSQSSELH